MKFHAADDNDPYRCVRFFEFSINIFSQGFTRQSHAFILHKFIFICFFLINKKHGHLLINEKHGFIIERTNFNNYSDSIATP